MPYTIDTDVADAVYRLNTTLEDDLGEQIRKVSRVNNPAAGDTVEDMMQGFEALTDAALVGTSGSVQINVTNASAVKGTSGIFSYVSHQMVLGFERAHPLAATKTVTTTFVIPAPANALYTGTTINIGSDPGDFASASGITETLARMIGWLEDNLIYEDITGAITVGGWTWVAGRSGIVTAPRLLDGNPAT